MDQPLICRRVAAAGRDFLSLRLRTWQVQGPAGEIVGQRLPDWRAFRDTRLDEGYRYEEIVKGSGAFRAVRSVSYEGNLYLSADGLAALWSTATFVKAFLAAHHAPDDYWRDFRNELRAAGEAFDVIVPISCVIAEV